MNISKFLASLIVAPIALTQAAFAQDSQPDSSKKSTMYAKPAVVRIVSLCYGTYTLYEDELHEKAIDTLTYNLSFIGTGFMINSNGYIVTSSKVIESEEDCINGLVRNIKEDLNSKHELNISEASIKNNQYQYGKFDPEFGGKTTNGERENGNEGNWDVYFPYSQNNPLVNKNNKPFEVKHSGRKEGQAIKINKDIAIIKVSMTNAPTLKLADSSQVQIQDKVIAVGYPNAADLNLGQDVKLTDRSYLESSVQEGRVSNPNKELDGGYPVLQIDIRAAEGSAGSPLINDQEEVIGMLIFNDSDKDSDDDNGESVPLAIPTSTIQEFIRQSGATNQQSKTDLLYKEGLQNFWKGKYKEARANFLQVKNLYPFHSEVERLISEIDQIEAERWAKPWTNPTYIFSAGVVLAAGAVGGVAYFLLNQRSNLAPAHSGVRGGVTGGNPVSTSSFKNNGRGKRCFVEMEYKGQIQRFELDRDEHHIGRDPAWSDFDIPTSWEVISRRHAVLRKQGEDYVIVDGDGTIPSRNGLWINDDLRVDPQEGHLLNNGDRLKIGQDAHEQILLTYYNPSSEQSNIGTTMFN